MDIIERKKIENSDFQETFLGILQVQDEYKFRKLSSILRSMPTDNKN